MAHVLAKPMQPKIIYYMYVVLLVIKEVHVKYITGIQGGVQAFLDLYSTCVTTRRLLNIHVYFITS